MPKMRTADPHDPGLERQPERRLASSSGISGVQPNQLMKLGSTRCGLSPQEAKTAHDHIAAAAMETQWLSGLRQSLVIGERVH